MHYITILFEKMYERTKGSILEAESTIRLRGYSPQSWAPSEFQDLKLPVNAIAYAICPTSRDTYFYSVKDMEAEQTWERYTGRVIDAMYRIIHNACKDYADSNGARDFDIYSHLLEQADDLVDQALRKHQSVLRKLDPKPAEADVTTFAQDLKKIVIFEALITAAWMNFELARQRDTNPGHIYQEYFDFNMDLGLTASHQGFKSPATPDFIYRHKVIGDIKSGDWHQSLEYTVVAYALAYEEHTRLDMDFGVILHVELPSSRRVPGHYNTNLIYLDDDKRIRFLALRNRKLEIVASGNDPGIPADKDECDPGCPFLSFCWGD